MKFFLFAILIPICLLHAIDSSAETAVESNSENPLVDRAPDSLKNEEPLSKEDQRILRRGEISEGRYIGGGVTGTVVGFGVGHAIQGRYPEKGWIFTAGEGASAAAIFIAVLSCFGDPPPGQTCTPPVALADAGLIGLVGFRIWEIFDLWLEPPKINERYHELKRTHKSATEFNVYPIVLMENKPGIGLTLSF